jgi:hypothetical protein
MGGGDALMSLLGLVIISFGFRVYTQRETMKRHFPEIVGATILSSIFSLFSTAFAAKAIGLSAGGFCCGVAPVCGIGMSSQTCRAGRASCVFARAIYINYDSLQQSCVTGSRFRAHD